MLASNQVPGPSEALFSAPFYRCVRNFYVAVAGNDANPGTVGSPWRTIQHADHPSRQAGDCINVLPGTYVAGATLSYGGNFAGATGYVVYRCAQLDACRITDSSGFAVHSAGSGPDYLVFDGFELAAGTPVTFGVGVGLFNARPATRTSHHIWVINNVIHGFGQGGVDMDSGDYLYYLHNSAFGNAHVACAAQGSGFAVVVAKPAAGYAPTAADKEFGPYHVVVAWNIAHDNSLLTCGSAQAPYDTDGNGIIIDDFANQGSDGVLFPYASVVFGNVAYRNGGAGILVGRSSYVTVANNTAYDNYLDPYNIGTFRAEISVSGGKENTVVGNIAYAVPATSPNDPRCRDVNYQRPPWKLPTPCPLQWNAALGGASNSGITDAGNVWSSNVTFGGSPPYIDQSGNTMWPPDHLSCGSASGGNLCNVDPKLSSITTGDFALLSNSPAIGYARQQTIVGFTTPDSGACTRTLATCGADKP